MIMKESWREKKRRKKRVKLYTIKIYCYSRRPEMAQMVNNVSELAIAATFSTHISLAYSGCLAHINAIGSVEIDGLLHGAFVRFRTPFLTSSTLAATQTASNPLLHRNFHKFLSSIHPFFTLYNYTHLPFHKRTLRS